MLRDFHMRHALTTVTLVAALVPWQLARVPTWLKFGWCMIEGLAI